MNVSVRRGGARTPIGTTCVALGDVVRPGTVSTMPAADLVTSVAVETGIGSPSGRLVGLAELAFWPIALGVDVYAIGFGLGPQQTFRLIVFGNRAGWYNDRDRRHWWSSRQSPLAHCLLDRRDPDRLHGGHRRKSA